MQNSKSQLKIRKLFKFYKSTFNFKLLTLNFNCEQARLQRFACNGGQALITLLFFIVVSVTITSAAIIIIILNSQSASSLEQGTDALSIAESGAENALMRLLRNPDYAGEPPLSVGNGTATISVTGTNPIVITSEGKIGNFARTIKIEVRYNNNIMTVSSWKEI